MLIKNSLLGLQNFQTYIQSNKKYKPNTHKNMSKTTAPFSIFINPTIVKQLENGPKITAVGQVVVYKTKDEKWEVDAVEIVDTEEIEFMGVKITDSKAQSETIKHFKTMGINLYEVMQEELEDMIRMSGGVETFTFEQTGIKLP
jgi:hypothetical protein